MAIPVTLVTGFLGAGKTTLVRSLLERSAQRIAVIENELAEVAVDQTALSGAVAVLELAGGCVCCSAREGLEPALDALLALDPQPDHIVIETSGVAAPGPVAEDLIERSSSGSLRLRRVVCVLDAGALDDIARRPEIGAQLAAADIVAVSKSDLATSEPVGDLIARVRGLTPFALVTTTAAIAADPEILLGPEGDRTESAFEPDPVATFAVGHGIESIVLRPGIRDAPGVAAWLRELVSLEGVLRVKGVVRTDAGDVGVQGVAGWLFTEAADDSGLEPALVVIGERLDRPRLERWAAALEH